MLKGFQKPEYVIVSIALCGLIGWAVLVASERPFDAAEYQNRLNVTATNILAPSDVPDESLKIYAVDVVHSRPFKKPFSGFGIYLRDGTIITAAHVVGRWPYLISHPHVFVAGQDLPAKVVKSGSINGIDLALLTVDQERLPVSLRLRRISLCHGSLRVGTPVVVVYPERTVRSRIISPLLIAPQYGKRFYSLVSDEQGSGSGVFDARRKCFLGTISKKIEKYMRRKENGHVAVKEIGFAGYFVPVPEIARFLAPEFRF
jgi:hypothetical protein